MGLQLNLGDIHLDFEIQGYHKTRKENWYDEWCKINLTLKSRDWLNYKIENDEIMLCCEIDDLIKHLLLVKNHTQKEKLTLSFIEPDFNFVFYPSEKSHRQLVDWIVNFWDDKKALTDNYLSLTLDALDIANLLNYLLHIQSENGKEYEPVTGDGLTQEQLDKKLEEGLKQAEAGEGIPAEEVFEKLRKEYGFTEPDDNSDNNGGTQ
ncbi:MAG: hypothetical protein IJT79_05145 [Ruminococcus sp.]|nr:hypothetical protein [Ruminococcus sp.]